MSKRRYKPKRHRRPIRPRHGNDNADYWLDKLEKRLNGFGASSSDLPEFDPDSCKSEKQHQHAVRVAVALRLQGFLHKSLDIQPISTIIIIHVSRENRQRSFG